MHGCVPFIEAAAFLICKLPCAREGWAAEDSNVDGSAPSLLCVIKQRAIMRRALLRIIHARVVAPDGAAGEAGRGERSENEGEDNGSRLAWGWG